MKTNSAAHKLMKARGIVLVLLLALTALLEFGLCESVAARLNQSTASRTEVPPMPTATLADLMAAMH